VSLRQHGALVELTSIARPPVQGPQQQQQQQQMMMMMMMLQEGVYNVRLTALSRVSTPANAMHGT